MIAKKRKQVYICIYEMCKMCALHLLITVVFVCARALVERERELVKFLHQSNPGHFQWKYIGSETMIKNKSRLLSQRKEWIPAKACIRYNVAITIIISVYVWSRTLTGLDHWISKQNLFTFFSPKILCTSMWWNKKPIQVTSTWEKSTSHDDFGGYCCCCVYYFSN